MSWPEGVQDSTALPFAVWQVLDTLSAHSPEETARLLGLTPQQVEQAVQYAGRAAQRQQRQQQPLNQDLTREVSQALMSCVGPIGSIMVEDALEELPRGARLGQLLRALAGDLAPEQQQNFLRQLESRNLV